MPPTRAQISVALDNAAGDALDALVANGASIGDAVRAAIVGAAHTHLEVDLCSTNQSSSREARHAALANSPDLANRSIEVLTANRSAARCIYDRLERMGAEAGISAARKGGRPAKYLLSRLALCGVCDAPLRVGAQNARRPRARGSVAEPSRYRVYECPGQPSQTGFHVSMRQEHLDQLITEAVLERVAQESFRVPSRLKDEAARDEHEALRLEIADHRAWLQPSPRSPSPSRSTSWSSERSRRTRPTPRHP